jgi:hypothetical protein
MDAPHTLVAHYLPADHDDDGNGIPDWWKSSTTAKTVRRRLRRGRRRRNACRRYGDRTDPLDADSVPAAPAIEHTPLDELRRIPAPLRSTLSFRHARRRTAFVYWHRKEEAWQTTSMTASSNDLFEASIGEVSEPGDDFEYQSSPPTPTAGQR